MDVPRFSVNMFLNVFNNRLGPFQPIKPRQGAKRSPNRLQSPQVLYLTESEVQNLFTMADAIEQMRLAFHAIREGATQNQSRRRLILPTGSVLHQMAGSMGKYFCTKIYTSNLKHGGLHQMFVLLYDAETGKPLAQIEANYMSLVRTGAATGFVADLLADPDISWVGLIGSGYQATAQLKAIRAIRADIAVRVWSRNPDHAKDFAEKYDCTAVNSAEAAVHNAQIVITATSCKDPVLEADWLQKGAFVAAMGSNAPNRRELSAELVNSAGLIVVDDLEQAKIEAGDLLLANDTPLEHWETLVEVKSILGEGQARYDPNRITIFKSLGIGVEDVAAAAFVYEEALKHGKGRRFGTFD